MSAYTMICPSMYHDFREAVNTRFEGTVTEDMEIETAVTLVNTICSIWYDDKNWPVHPEEGENVVSFPHDGVILIAMQEPLDEISDPRELVDKAQLDTPMVFVELSYTDDITTYVGTLEELDEVVDGTCLEQQSKEDFHTRVRNLRTIRDKMRRDKKK